MSKIIVLLISLILVTTFAYSETVEVVDYSITKILEDGQMWVRKETSYFDNGEYIKTEFHRYVLDPGQDVSKEVEKIKNEVEKIWTQEVIDERNEWKAKDKDK